jgi:hypothetical protein
MERRLNPLSRWVALLRKSLGLFVLCAFLQPGLDGRTLVAACFYSIAPSDQVHGPGQESSVVSVEAPAGCAWNVVNTNAWISVTAGASGSGNGTVSYTVAANPLRLVRTGWMLIAGEQYQVTQLEAPCVYRVSPTNRTHGYGAAENTFSVTTSNDCAWTVLNTNAWIIITAGGTGTNNGTVSYHVLANPSPDDRVGVLTVEGQAFTITQRGAPCLYELSATNRLHGYTATTNTVSVSTTVTCTWTAVSSNDWVTLLSGSSGQGNGVVQYAVAANPYTVDRTTVIWIQGEILFITQRAAPCTYEFTPASGIHGAGAETGLVSIATSTNCVWDAVTTNDWITLLGPTDGVGNGSVGYALTANPAGTPRTGTLRIGGTPFSITQAGAPCTFALAPANRAHGFGLETGTVAVTTLPGCAWNATASDPWITLLAGSTGSGSGTVTYRVAANPDYLTRTGTVTIADQTFTITQAALPCAFSLSPSSTTRGYAAVTGTVSVLTGDPCSWTVANSNSWITILSGASGLGNGVVTYALQENQTPEWRTGVVMIADQPFTVIQRAPDCWYQIGPTNEVFYQAGATGGVVQVTSTNDCTWTVVKTNTWITLLSGTKGTNSGTVSFAVAANPDYAPRSGVMVIAGLPFTITQAAQACAYTLSPSSTTRGYSAVTGTVSVVTGSPCSWTVANPNPWITILSGASGTGSGTVTYALAENQTPDWRTGLVQVADQTFTIIQRSPVCLYEIGPTNAVFYNAGATSGVVHVTTIGTDCTWNVVKTNDWITLLSGTKGTNHGTVSFNVAANPDYTPRSGVVVIAGLPFTITQAGLPCTYTLSPQSTTRGYSSVTGSVNVVTGGPCPWTVDNPNPWITLLSGVSGTGSGTVTYALAENQTPHWRTGLVMIADQTFTIIQRSPTCFYEIGPTNAVFYNAGATSGVVSVTTGTDCTWTVVKTNDWITLPSGTKGTNSGPVSFTVAANPDYAARSGVLVIAGHAFTITQAALPCTYSISPTSTSRGYGAATGTVSVATGGPCAWTVENPHPWITILAGASGTGNGTVTYALAENPTLAWRTGLVQIAGQTFTVSQQPTVCTYRLSPTTRTHGYAGATNSISLTAGDVCPWAITLTNDWISIQGDLAGTGPATIHYVVTPNLSPLDRTGVVMIADQPFTLIQRSPSCFYEIAPSGEVFFEAVAATGTVNVTTTTGCTWTVVKTNDWITLLTGTRGTNSDTVSYTVDANPAYAPRSGVLVIAGLPLTITQAARTCSYALSPSSRSHGYGATTNNVTITADIVCSWTVDNPHDWITLLSPAGGSGSAVVTYAVEANPTFQSRTGVLTIGGQPFTVSQQGQTCTYRLSPTSRTHGYGMVSNSVSVTAPAGCGWSVVNPVPWISITAGASGSGNGSFAYTVWPNPTATERTAVLTVADQTFTLTQRGFAFAPTNVFHGADAATGAVAVTTCASCNWTVICTNDWITLLSPTNHTGNGSLSYALTANTAPAPRTGEIILGGRPFAVTQAGTAGQPLRLLRPVRQPAGQFRIFIGHADGSPVEPALAAQVEVFASADPGLPQAQWTKLTAPVVWNNGLLQLDDTSCIPCPVRFYRARLVTAPTAGTALRLHAPQLQPQGHYRLLIGQADGNGVDLQRAAKVELFATTNVALPWSEWTKLTNSLWWNNGLLQLDDMDSATRPLRFYRAMERP